MKKRKLKGPKEMTNKEFVKLLDELWYIDPEEEEALLEESFKKGRRKLIRQKKEKMNEAADPSINSINGSFTGSRIPSP
jgi:hypothetical protein